MKYTPTITLALALAAGVAGAAAAQTMAPTTNTTITSPTTASTMSPTTAAPTTESDWHNGASHPSFAQPQANASQLPAANGTLQAPAYGGTMPAADGQAQMQPAPQMQNSQAQDSGTDRVREAQQRLQAAGMYNGPVDGKMDPDTRAAISRYQEHNGLRLSGDLDAGTFERLTGKQTVGSGSSMPGQATTPAANSAGANTGTSTTGQSAFR